MHILSQKYIALFNEMLGLFVSLKVEQFTEPGTVKGYPIINIIGVEGLFTPSPQNGIHQTLSSPETGFFLRPSPPTHNQNYFICLHAIPCPN